MQEEKYCCKCGQTYPATLEYFYKGKRNKNGLVSWCKTCTSKTNAKNSDLRRGIPNYFTKAEQELSIQGIPKVDIKLNHKYQFIIPTHMNNVKDQYFQGKAIYITDRHITFEHTLGFKETFLKWDLNNFNVKEV